jgi:endonuclease YncB( thermonuclease family)
VNIAGGDTVSLLDENNTQHKIRLYGIDTPERDQPYGLAARRALTRFIDANNIGVVVVETDSYGRQVGTLYSNGVNINQAMVASGNAWWYRHYARNERELAAAEREARDERRGLWAGPDAVAPWEWHRRKR